MSWFHFFCLGLLISAMPGCTSRAKARAEVQRAYAAGRMQAIQQLQQANGPSVTVLGQVQTPLVRWEEGLTLAEAIINANYLPPDEPLSIVILRQGQAIPVDPKRLLRGEDLPVLAGDIIEIRP